MQANSKDNKTKSVKSQFYQKSNMTQDLPHVNSKLHNTSTHARYDVNVALMDHNKTTDTLADHILHWSLGG